MSDRTDFNLTWLLESPTGIGKFPTYEGLCYNIHEAILDGNKIISLSNNLKKIESGDTLFYWYGDKKNILLGSELHIRSQGLVVTITGKDPILTKNKQPPYASDLYINILNDTKKAIRLLSDEQLSDEGYNIWKRLYNGGLCVSVYDNQEKNVGVSFKKFRTYEDFQSFFKHGDPFYKRYQYVLAKRGSAALTEVSSYFGLRRTRELAGVDVEDFDPSWRNEKL